MTEKYETLARIVGKENFSDDQETLGEYSQEHSFVKKLQPWFVVKPMNSDIVQEIVKWANQTGTPLVPVSSGPPHFRGDTVPSVPGAVAVDLSNMNKIIRIDRKNRMTIVEPGVTFSQLQPELAKAGLRLTTPLLPRSNKSVVSSLLEREPILIPRLQWAALDPLRCVEVVWGDGQKMTTGDAKSLGSLEEEWELGLAQNDAAGPGQADFYRFVSSAQGSMGIVTWASIKCEVLPQIHKIYFFMSFNLKQLIEFAYKILRMRFGDEIFLLNNTNLAYILTSDHDEIKKLKERIPPWIVVLGIAGRDRLPNERVSYQSRDIADIARHCGLEMEREIPCSSNKELPEIIFNHSSDPYWKLRYKDECRDIFFLTTLDKTPEFIEKMYSVLEKYNYDAADMGVYLQPVQQGASCHCEFNLPYDSKNDWKVSRMKDLYNKASEELSSQGAFYSRPYGSWASIAFNRDFQTTRIVKKLKNIFDPNNIMNPGKLCF